MNPKGYPRGLKPIKRGCICPKRYHSYQRLDQNIIILSSLFLNFQHEKSYPSSLALIIRFTFL